MQIVFALCVEEIGEVGIAAPLANQDAVRRCPRRARVIFFVFPYPIESLNLNGFGMPRFNFLSRGLDGAESGLVRGRERRANVCQGSGWG